VQDLVFAHGTHSWTHICWVGQCAQLVCLRPVMNSGQTLFPACCPSEPHLGGLCCPDELKAVLQHPAAPHLCSRRTASCLLLLLQVASMCLLVLAAGLPWSI
jgi:hypothetical protein